MIPWCDMLQKLDLIFLQITEVKKRKDWTKLGIYFFYRRMFLALICELQITRCEVLKM